VAAKRVFVHILDKMWGWAKEKLLGSNLLKNKLLLFRGKNKVNAWHLELRTSQIFNVCTKKLANELASDMHVPSRINNRNMSVGKMGYQFMVRSDLYL